LTKTSTKTLVNNPQWGEIATLIRLALFAGNSSKQLSHHQLYVPEILHVVSYTAGCGPTLVRTSVYGVILNLLQSIYVSRVEDAGGPDLLNLINECTRPETIRLFGLERITSTSEYTNSTLHSDKAQLDNQQGLVHLLMRIMELTSGSQGLSMKYLSFVAS
jgi:hypothetical protein